MALTKVKGEGVGTLSSGLTLTSDDPTITMTDSSGTNDIATLQATSGALIITTRDGSSDGEIIFKRTDGSATDESMRINAQGHLFLGTSSTFDGNIYQLEIGQLSGRGILLHTTGTSTNYALIVQNDNGSVGSISTNGSSTTFATSSDHRLKENVTANWDATTRLKQLNPIRFNFIADPDTTVDGFLAHEVQTVVPEAITGSKDEVDDNGNPVMQGIDQAKLVPLLVKTIQELEARIAALEAG